MLIREMPLDKLSPGPYNLQKHLPYLQSLQSKAILSFLKPSLFNIGLTWRPANAIQGR